MFQVRILIYLNTFLQRIFKGKEKKWSVMSYLIGSSFAALFIAPSLSFSWQVGVFLEPILIMLPQKSINYFPLGQPQQWRGSAIL